MTRKLTFFIAFAILPMISRATNVTLQDNFIADDNAQLFSVSLAAPAAVDIRSYGYAGGTTSTGAVVPRGGFDTILTLFSASGVFIDDNDDGADVAVDPSTGLASDARITANLTAGSYVLALTQYDNFSIGNLADGFVETGNHNFTADPGFASGGACPGNMFRDISGTAGRCRSGNWTVDFVNVGGVTAVPEPSALLLAGVGLALLFAARRRKPGKMPVLGLAVIAVLVSIPAYAQATGPDYGNVNDFLNGKRSLLNITDIAIFNGQGIPSTITTSNSSQTMASSFTLPGVHDQTKRARIFSARVFNQAAGSTLTPLYDYNNSALLTFLIQSVANVPNNSVLWQPFAGGDEPDITGGLAADFNSDGYDEMALGFADGRMLIGTANDVNDASKSLRQTTTTNLDVLSDMTAGDFKGDGGREIAGLTISNGSLKLVIYAVDPQSLTATTINSLTLTTPGASPSTPITLASITRGRFNSTGHDQLAVAFTTAAGPAYVEVIDFTPGTLNPHEASPTLGSPAGNVGFPDGYIQVKTGQFGLPNNQYDQIVYHSSSPQAGGRFFEILTVDSLNFAIGGTAPVLYDQFPCALGVQVGNFDHRQSDPSTPGQTQPDLNNQVAFLYCSGNGVNPGIFTTTMNIYSVDPASLNLIAAPDSALNLGFPGEILLADSGSRVADFVAVDLQGRSLTLGEPTVFNMETNIKPSVIIAAPPMHVDFISPIPGSTAPMVMNLTAAPHTFTNTYNFESDDTNKVDDSRKTSWSFGAKEQLSAKYYVGDVDSFGFQVSDSISATQKIKSSVDEINGSYTAKQSTLSSSSSFDDEVTYKDSGIKIWSYPVIGKMVCPTDKSPCQTGDLVPLTIQFSGPTGAPESEFAAGGSLLWYQPPWEPGNVLSYPATLQQLQQMYLEPTKPGSTPVSSLSLVAEAASFFTGGGALKEKTTWSGTTNTETDTSFNQNYSFENDFSVTDSIGEENVAGSSLNFNLDLNGSYALSHLNNESTQLGTSSGLEVSVAQAFNSTYQYLVSPYIFGTMITNAVVDNQPLNNPNSPNPPVQTFGVLRGMFTADPLATGSGRWWAEAYPQPDVALNHPQRWLNTQPGVPAPGDPIPSNCLAGGTGGSSLDCAVLNTRIADNPWLSYFHQMRGLFVTSANFAGQGPQLMRATAGDKLALTARVYNYSLTPMPAGTQVHVRFYFAPWKGAYAVKNQPSVQIIPPNPSPGTTDLILDPIPPFSEGSPNWVLATTTFDTSAYEWTKNGNVDVVFWVVVWMEDGTGAMVPEMPGHGLTSIPGTLTSFADAANLEEVQADKNSYSNNVGFYPQVFAIEAKDSGLTGRPRANVTVNLSKIDVSDHNIALGSRVDLLGTLLAEDGTADSVKVRYYDGDPAKNGRLIAMDLIPRVMQGDPYPIAKSYRPTTCGVHQLFAVVNKGKATEVVRRAQPVRVACEPK